MNLYLEPSCIQECSCKSQNRGTHLLVRLTNILEKIASLKHQHIRKFNLQLKHEWIHAGYRLTNQPPNLHHSQTQEVMDVQYKCKSRHIS